MAYIDIISLANAKLYLRVDDTLTEDNAQITNMISVALKHVEDNTQILVYARDKTYRMINGFKRVYDSPINSVIKPSANVFATATAQCTSVIATNTLVANGLTYTAVSGDPSDDTEFDISGTDTQAAISLSRAINADSRTGTLANVTGVPVGDTVTLTTTKKGYAGNATTLTQTGGTITVSGATFTGGLDGDFSTGNIVEDTLYTSYAFGSINRDLILNVGYATASDVPLDIIQVAYEIIDILYYGEETGKTMADLSPLSVDILNQSNRFVF